MEQNREPRNKPIQISQLISGAKAIQWNKDISFQQMVLEQSDLHMQKNIDTDIINLDTKINAKLIISKYKCTL